MTIDTSHLGLRTLDSTSKRGRSVIIYGDAGRGKTTLLNTLKGRILLFSSDCGEQVLYDGEGRKFDVCELVDDRNQDPVSSIEKFEGMVTWLLEKKELPWDYVVLDNVTELQNLYLEAMQVRRSVKYPAQIDYRNTGIEVKRNLRNLRNLTYKGVNVIYIVWEDTNKIDDYGGEVVSDKGPMIMGKAQKIVCGLVDFVMAMRVDKKGGRYLQLDGDVKYIAKKREEEGKEYPSFIQCPKGEEDTLQKFFDLI